MADNPQGITEADVDDAVARAFGRTPERMSLDEAVIEIVQARAFGRDPDLRAVEAKREVEIAQEAVADLAPWRAAVHWDQYGELCDLEERLAQLTSSRRGQTIEAAREYTMTQLREAWVKGGDTTHGRFVATEKVLREGIAHFAKLAPIASSPPTAPRSAPPARPAVAERRVTITEADVDKAVARAFGRKEQ